MADNHEVLMNPPWLQKSFSGNKDGRQDSGFSSEIPQPPFPPDLYLPGGTHHDGESILTGLPVIIVADDELVEPQYRIQTFLAAELIPRHLNRIHRKLWLAGLPRFARPLHRQILLRREIVITENPNQHLVWHESRIFLKPLPEYLFSYDFWVRSLCSEKELYKCACGLILSYVWLVRYVSDFRIAKSSGLLPDRLEWHQWSRFATGFMEAIDPYGLGQVNQRYEYGELRLTRLNYIFLLEPSNLTLRNVIRGYMGGSSWTCALVSRNFAWLFGILFYATAILTSLQVGLATEGLKEHVAFQQASYGLTVVSLMGNVIVVATVCGVVVLLSFYHVLSTISYGKGVKARRAEFNKRSV
ncbi:MAG: hypothetical protein Q9163_004244 [Psora crenata]